MEDKQNCEQQKEELKEKEGPIKKKYEPSYDITYPNFTPEYDFNGDFFSLNVFQKDSLLKLFKKHFEMRNSKYEELFDRICKYEGGIINFARSYKHYGVIAQKEGILYREWLPGAKEVYLIGDFNDWNREQFAAERKEFGKWELFLPNNEKNEPMIAHNSRIKIHLKQANDNRVDRIPAWIRYAVQNEEDKTFSGCFWNPPGSRFQFKHESPIIRRESLRIYECHIGMAGIEPRVHSYQEFIKEVLPRVKQTGYNCIQIMAIMEHPYYGSFGYHVSSFFGVSSRFGTPDDFKELVDIAHSMGIIVLMDLIHSHATKNCQDGLNQLDGTDHLYFHEGGAGVHSQWDSRIFNYSNWEVLRFLLSNLAWYLEEYNIDGFRFDGITSMMYKHHGIGQGFSGDYHEYFSEWTDLDAVVYLMLANTLIKRIKPNAITIAEDVSGMPTLGSAVSEGGIGFDYRLAMAIPDKWIQLLKTSDEFWSMEDIFFTLWNRRYDENVIAYCESHDQAIVGDKTISMHLFDAEIYWNMSLEKQETIIVNRGIALHKLIRIITLALGGDAYLNFMGNEFGHPEWIDFPREGNGWSYEKCIRRWDLADNEKLRYKYLLRFDREMLKLEAKYQWLKEKKNHKTLTHDIDKIIIFERAGLIFVFNFHPTQSYTDYVVGSSYPFPHKIIFDSDDAYFGGQDRMKAGYTTPFPYFNQPTFNKPYSVKVYLPSRTMLVLKPVIDQKQLEQEIKDEDQEHCEFKISNTIMSIVMQKEEKESRMRREIEEDIEQRVKEMTEKLNQEKSAKIQQLKSMISNEFKNELEQQIKEIKKEFQKK